MRGFVSCGISLALLLGSILSCLAAGPGLTPSEAVQIQKAVGTKRVGDFVQRILDKGTPTTTPTPVTPGPTTVMPIPTTTSSTTILPSSTPPSLTSTTILQSSTPQPGNSSIINTSTNPPIDTTSVVLPTTTYLPTTTVLPTSSLPMTSPPTTTPSDKCLRLPGQTACSANMCAPPPNPGYDFCGCGELDQSVDIEVAGGLTNLTYYTCLRNIAVDLILFDDPDLATLDGLEDLISIQGSIQIISNPVLQNIGSTLLALQTVGDVTILLNDGLTTIDGFNALQSIGNFSVANNLGLTTISGFEALRTVNGDLQFIQNDAITQFDIASFTALESVEGVFAISTDDFGGAALSSISGFAALTSVRGPFEIRNNLLLQTVTGFTALANITTADDNDRYVRIDCADTGTPPALADISGLVTLAQCGLGNAGGDPQYSSGDPYLNSITVKIDLPQGASVTLNGCTLSTWDDVCAYIFYGTIDDVSGCYVFG